MHVEKALASRPNCRVSGKIISHLYIENAHAASPVYETWFVRLQPGPVSHADKVDVP